ncbi:hypothetical protein N665_0069s0043 [Sinapis alba]|nr:hypothetical protein N665_0069s0043 [Sinapis alba]
MAKRTNQLLRVKIVKTNPILYFLLSVNKNNKNSFIVWDVNQFFTRILPKSVEFGRNFSEFVSELCYHRFQRIGQFEFGHENFPRSRPWLLKRMRQRKTRKVRAKVVRLLENLQI